MADDRKGPIDNKPATYTPNHWAHYKIAPVHLLSQYVTIKKDKTMKGEEVL